MIRFGFQSEAIVVSKGFMAKQQSAGVVMRALRGPGRQRRVSRLTVGLMRCRDPVSGL